MNALKPWHIIVLLVLILLLFGAKRLPDLAKSVGESLKIFKNEMKDLTDDGSTKPPPSAQPPLAPPGVPPVAPPTQQAPASAPPVPLPPPYEGFDGGGAPRP
jgi:sec-independent protein translocase protein TatA